MPTANYDAMRHFADSWGLLYMFVIFLAVTIMLFLPGAAKRARAAAEIPLSDERSSSAIAGDRP
jgi:cytochrome c oxidase cbb3-type subunit IV